MMTEQHFRILKHLKKHRFITPTQAGQLLGIQDYTAASHGHRLLRDLTFSGEVKRMDGGIYERVAAAEISR